MKSLIIIFLFVINTAEVIAFGQTGHRITGKIAEQYLTPAAKNSLIEILGNESLAEVSTYADEMRSNPSEFWQKQSSPYHYVTIPDGKNYSDVGAPSQGDAFYALNKYSKNIRNPQSTKAHKALAVKFIVHLIGDLHQPFHVGNGTDRGGNDVKINFFGKDSNLHYIWDTGMINRKELSFTEWSEWLAKKISPKNIKEWSQIDPKIWIKESQEIRLSAYPNKDAIRYTYLYDNLPILKVRLQKASVRIAAYLNHLFEENIQEKKR